MVGEATESVMALVLTYNSRDGLERCLRALGDQVRPVREIVVVDNASKECVDDVASELHRARVIRQYSNEGPAGGHARGLEEFLKSDATFRWAWVMDDDCEPAPDALARLLTAAAAQPEAGVVFPNAVSAATGEPIIGVGWWGVLISRSVVDQVGVPLRELFWWAEDTEYLQWRIPHAGFPSVRAVDARVVVRTERSSRAKPAWKYYYEARGTSYYRLHVQYPTDGPPGSTKFTARIRIWRMSRSLTKLLLRALVVERDHRTRKAGMVVRGAIDGCLGRLGPRVSVDESHRPEPSAPSQL
jgi:GT2 family glycosyltransferase